MRREINLKTLLEYCFLFKCSVWLKVQTVPWGSFHSKTYFTAMSLHRYTKCESALECCKRFYRQTQILCLLFINLNCQATLHMLICCTGNCSSMCWYNNYQFVWADECVSERVNITVLSWLKMQIQTCCRVLTVKDGDVSTQFEHAQMTFTSLLLRERWIQFSISVLAAYFEFAWLIIKPIVPLYAQL